jgi:hypothetical protein
MKRSRRSWFYEWVADGVSTRKHHALAVSSPMRLQHLMVVWPFHYLVRWLFWIDYRWNAYRTRPTFIEREIRYELTLYAAARAGGRVWTEEIVRGAVREVVGVITRRVVADWVEKNGRPT